LSLILRKVRSPLDCCLLDIVNENNSAGRKR
jgi:hypothetical protein